MITTLWHAINASMCAVQSARTMISTAYALSLPLILHAEYCSWSWHACEYSYRIHETDVDLNVEKGNTKQSL